MNSNQCTQSVVSPRIYTYKITFEDVPFYYYGAHKEKVFNEEYYGTPYTHKWCWEMYQPKKQILEVFDYTDEGWIDALNVEKRLIRPVYNSDPYCLNESCGGRVSLSIVRNNGRANVEGKKGIWSLTDEEKKVIRSKGGIALANKRKEEDYDAYVNLMSEMGKKGGATSAGGKASYEKKVGVFALTKEQQIENGRRGGSIAGRITKERGTGIFSIAKEQQIENGRSGGTKTQTQRWKCLVTGHISNPASLARYQKARGIDTSMRVRLEE